LSYPELFPGQSWDYDPSAWRKRIEQDPRAGSLLAVVRQVLLEVEPFAAPQLERALQTFVDERHMKTGDIIHALRVATTGKGVGFGMFETLEILGRDECVQRIDAVLQRLGTRPSQAPAP
jgi:glutamyl-tRNA synthetase